MDLEYDDLSPNRIANDLNSLLDAALEAMENQIGLYQKQCKDDKVEKVQNKMLIENTSSSLALRKCFVTLTRLPDKSEKNCVGTTKQCARSSQKSKKLFSCKIPTVLAVPIGCVAKHSQTKSYTCYVCNYCTSKKSMLVKHVRIHSGNKRSFTCKVCEQNFGLKSNLLRHVKIHTRKKPFTCKVCKRNFTYSTTLIQHVRIHTGEKPFTCKVCNRSFRQRSALIRHVKIHTREKRFI